VVDELFDGRFGCYFFPVFNLLENQILKLLVTVVAFQWHNGSTPTSFQARNHDFATVARRVVEQAIGEHLDGTPLDDPNAGKNPKAIARGKLGGAKGGDSRAKALSPEKRKVIAKKAAQARWNRPADDLTEVRR
jgi:hypothetical protein